MMNAEAGGGARRIAVTGASGFIGSALCEALSAGGHHVTRLRHRSDGEKPGFSSEDGRTPADLAPIDAVIHLAGENIASSRWNAEKKRKIRESRVAATQTLCESLAALATPPEVLISASAVGYYGNRASQELAEEDDPGAGFLAEVCVEWEAACAPARQKGIRVVNTRFGMVLGPEGGALSKMLPAFKLGMGGALGDGLQYVSWISLRDAVMAIQHCLFNRSISGPVNLTAPEAVSNLQFAKTLAALLNRPSFMGVPAAFLRLALGEMADEVLLSSSRVLPRKLLKTGYSFAHPALESALLAALG